MATAHAWTFFRAGGLDQARLETAADLQDLDQLDQKLWVALACPIRGIEFDTRTLELIDTDKDGRLRVPEVLAAVRWACSLLKQPESLLAPSVALSLTAIQDANPEGRQLIAAAKHILAGLGKPAATSITVEEAADTARLFAQTRFNGDGIVPEAAAADEAGRAVIRDVIACVGSDPDRSGQPGVSQARADAFFSAAQAYADWQAAAENDPLILPLGPATVTAIEAVHAVRGKVDDYFARCRLAAFDARAQAALNREEKDYLALAARDLTISSAEIAALPLARIVAGEPLPLTEAVNPAWAGAIAALRAAAVAPLLGDRAALTEAEWATLTAKLAPGEAWRAARAGTAVEPLGLARVRALLAGPARAALNDLIAQDRAVEAETNAIAAVEKLARLQRDLARLLANFVNFRDFYGRKQPAVFQAGTLYLDRRSCELCLSVEDVAKHAAMASLAGACLVYCDCTRKSTGEKRQIVAAMTDGDSDNLMVGRNGLFYDRQGRDWDATVIKIVDNPISLRQAFWSPYKKFVRLVEEQIAKRAAAADAASHARLETAAVTVAAIDQAKPAPAPKKFDAGTVAAMGVGLGAIATVLGGFVAGVLSLTWWQMPLALIGLVLAISTPSVIIAWLKLRKRNLGPLLDANGWAVNAKATLTLPLGRSLTRIAALPAGSQRDLVDPFAEEKGNGKRIVLAVLVVLLAWALWYFGTLERVLPGVLPKSCWTQVAR